MALIVEDGTGLANAESYISVADADTYHSNRNVTAWAALSTPIKEGCLRKATDFIEGVYRAVWKGTRMKSQINQALNWPRAYVYMDPFLHGADGEFPYLFPNNVVPNEVKNACASLALRASTKVLDQDKARQINQKTVGPITIKYDQNSSDAVEYSQIDKMLSAYLEVSASSNMVKLVRC